MKRAVFIISTLACTYCTHGHAQVASGPDHAPLTEKWLMEAKTQWQRYLQEMSHFEVEKEVKNEWNRSIIDHEPETRNYRAVADYPRALLYVYFPNSHRVEEVRGVNAEYQFRLTPAGNDPEQWVVTRFGELPPPSPECQFSKASMHEIDVPCDAIINQYLASALALNTTLLPSLVGLDGFRVTSVKESTRDGQRIASVTYDYEPVSPPRKVHTRSGTVHLLVDHYWLVDSADFFVGETIGSTFRCPFSVKNTYNFADSSVPVLTSSECKCFNNTPDRTWRYSMTYRFRIQRTEDRSPGRFTLTAFGLPEADLRSPWRPYRLWLAIVSVIVMIAIAMGGGLYRIFSRRRGMPGR